MAVGIQFEDGLDTMEDLDFEGDLDMEPVEFDQEKCRDGLLKMIIIDGLPFTSVEKPGLQNLLKVMQPQFEIPSAEDVERDCIQLFEEEKEKLKSILSSNLQMVSLTIDTWTSIEDMTYLCVTAHFIDEGWDLHKKILSFGVIPDREGESIGEPLKECLKDWGIVKISTITVDKSIADSTIPYLVRSVSDWNGSTILKGECMHLRCFVDLLNSIVCDEMKKLDSSIGKIRASCRYLMSSSTGLASFKRCVQLENLPTNQILILDLPTNWNTTYLMLEAAEKFEKAFTRLESDDPSYLSALETDGGPPNYDDWNQVRILVKLLKIFHDTILAFSRSWHVTADTFFRQLYQVLYTLSKWMESDDLGLQRMATNVKTEVDKYWDINGNLNYLLLVAVVLNPRYKLEYIEFCFSHVYGPDEYKEILKNLIDLLEELFAKYEALYPFPPDACDAGDLSSHVTSQSQVGHDDNSENVNLLDKFKLRVKGKRTGLIKNELDRYLNDDLEDGFNGFDILGWWRGNTTKYYVLSRMARDILAIPVSTVSLEYAFNTEGRVLDEFRSLLSDTTAEALICVQSWLKSSTKVGDSQGPEDEAELSGAGLKIQL